jgi:hypothetical protein
MTGPDWKLEDDYKSVTVTFPTNPPVALRLDIGGVDDILKNLGHFRAAMKPEIARAYAMGQKVGAVPDPIWVTEPDLMQGDSLLHLRDPRYGWLHYLLPRAEALKLGQLLQKQAETPDQSPAPDKAN